MIASDVIRAVLAALLAVSTELYQIYILAFTLSCVSCFFLPAQTVAIPLLVRKEELLVANSINAQTVQLIRVISPAVAGALVAWAGHEVCFYIDSLSFVISAALLSTITLHREITDTETGIRSVPLELVKGLKFIAQHRAILFLTVSMTAAILAIGAFDAVIVVYVRDILSADSRLFGLLISIVGGGTILGALLLGKFGQRTSKLSLVVLGIFGIGINVLILAVLSSVVATVVCSFGLGLSVACVLIPSQTLMQEESPQSMLGRVSSTSMSLMTAAQLCAFLVAGSVASWVGIRNLYLLVALTLVLISVFAFGFKSAIRVTEVSPSSGQTPSPHN